MRKKLLLFSTGFIVLLCSFLNFTEPPSRGYSPQTTSEKPFLLGAMNNQTDWEYDYISDPDTFGMNLWHTYIESRENPITGRLEPLGWDYGSQNPTDLLDAPIGDYEATTEAFLQKTAANNMHGLLHRPKIEWLCYGQRSDYQCEDKQYVDDNLWFYSFQTSGGISQQDNTQHGDGQYVMYCSQSASTDGGQTFMSAGPVLSRLRCNNQQTKNVDGWRYDAESTWFVKPSIRVPASFPGNNPETDVCVIKVYDSDGQLLIPEVTIKGKHFLNPQSQYSGDYLEEFYFTANQPPVGIEIEGAWGDTGPWSSRGNEDPDTGDMSKADIQVVWSGNCDMWIDYVRVDNDVADGLMNPNSPNFNTYNDWLEWEAKRVADYTYNGFRPAYRFYIEEIEFNNMPCIEYVNKKLQEYSYAEYQDTVDMLVCFYWANFTNHMPGGHAVTNGYWKEGTLFDAETLNEVFMEPAGLREFFTETYQFSAPQSGGSYLNKLPNTFDNYIPDPQCVFATSTTPSQYEEWLQDQLDMDGYPNPGVSMPDALNEAFWVDQGFFRWAMNMANDLSKLTGKPFINMPQAHLWKNEDIEKRKEPTNEEMHMATNLALSYGAKGIIFFWYGGFNNCNSGLFGKGFLDDGGGEDQIKREANAYGQDKWKSLIDLHQRIRKWAPHLMQYDYDYTNSYAYYRSDDRSALKSSTYINNIAAYPPIPTDLDEISTTADAEAETYLQAAVFKNDSANSQYIMITNRRCSPYDPGENENGGRRRIKIQFDNGAGAYTLNGFNNWKIIDLENYSHVVTFDKNSTNYVDLGWFLPGEGRLYKLAPVMQEGGTFVTNETTGETFDCKGEVLNGGKDITLTAGATISFTNNGKITMTGGQFKSGNIADGPSVPMVTLKGKSQAWDGISLSACSLVDIYRTKFEDIVPYFQGSNYAIKVVDCLTFKVNASIFNMEQNTGGIGGTYVINTAPRDLNIQVDGNSFVPLESSNVPSVNFTSTGSVSMPALITNNEFNVSAGQYPSTGISLSGITGGVIEQNQIEDYHYGLMLLSTSIDILDNDITASSSLNSSKGIFGGTSSTMNMSFTSYMAGMNRITNYGTGAMNVEVDNSKFLIHQGLNSFDIKDNPSDEYHLYGVFPESPMSLYELAEENCFKINAAYDNTPYHDVIWEATQDPVDFDFEDYVCIASYTSGEYYVVDLGEGVYDTIYIGGGSGGEGSGLSSAQEVDGLYGSICLEIRKRNYAQVSSAGYGFLDDHPQSSHSIDVIAKLYLACLMQDSSGNKITPLKSYLEELILDNPENDGLIERSFYYIQKCKVALGQYQSAMDGFQQIMTQNPGTYEALVASWDYAAASLLMNGGGSGGSKSGSEFGDMGSKLLSQLEAWINYDDPKDIYNEKKFTKEDRKTIKVNVVNTFKDKREKQAEKDRELQIKADNGDALAVKELKTRSVLKEEIKAYHPETITEHTEKIQSTVKKVFAYDPGVSSKPQNTIPTDYELSQNFPNPFNPTTKIQYALPRDGKVQLIIYDILGREMAKLVNNEFKAAGRYVSEFNGSRLASGIYFYRILVNDGKDFNSVKKMVLIK